MTFFFLIKIFISLCIIEINAPLVWNGTSIYIELSLLRFCCRVTSYDQKLLGQERCDHEERLRSAIKDEMFKWHFTAWSNESEIKTER